MRIEQLDEGVGRIVKGVNTTQDVGPNQTSIEAAKFGNSVDKDGRPPTLSKKVRGKSTNVLFNLGLAESLEKSKKDNFRQFAVYAADMLGIQNNPKIRITDEVFDDTFGYFNNIDNSIIVSYANRHQMDVMRTLAHELVHFRQREQQEELDGSDGSYHENEANAIAGVILRKWAQKNPQLFSEKWTPMELALMEGGHELPVKTVKKKPGRIFEALTTKRSALEEALGELSPNTQIYVDMDGVLADFFGEWAKLMNVDHFTDISKQHDINDALQKIRDTDQFWLNLPLLPQARSLLSLIKRVKGSYSICSSPLADDPRSEPHKREWIKNNLSFFPPTDIYITHNKPQFATQKDGTPNILIDDYGVNIEAWEDAGGIGFKYKDHKFERTADRIKAMVDPR